MDDQARQRLRDAVATHGPTLVSDARRVADLLADLPDPQLSALVAAVHEGVPAVLIGSGSPRGQLLDGLARRLVEHRAISVATARWAVETWAMALAGATVRTGADATHATVALPAFGGEAPTVVTRPAPKSAPTPTHSPSRRKDWLWAGGVLCGGLLLLGGLARWTEASRLPGAPEVIVEGSRRPPQQFIDGIWKLRFARSSAVLAMQGTGGTMRVAFVNSAGTTVEIDEQMRLWAIDQGLIVLGAAPVQRGTGMPMGGYEPDTLLFRPQGDGRWSVSHCKHGAGRLRCVPAEVFGKPDRLTLPNALSQSP